MSPHSTQRNDDGFSFIQMIVTMVIGGILLTTVGFAAFNYIQTARETVLESNIRTAAEAVQNTLALTPSLRTADAGADAAATEAILEAGVPSAALISALSNSAGFTWTPVKSVAGAEDGWVFPELGADIGPEVVRIQMINQDDAFGNSEPAARGGTSPALPEAPVVRWLVADRDAVRIQVRNEDGSWACALIVLRPDWNSTMAGSGTPTDTQILTAEGNLRGIWYDAGSNIPTGNDGIHHCSPTSVAASAYAGTAVIQTLAAPASFGNGAAGDAIANATHDPLPVSGSVWNIPGDGTTEIPNRLLRRSVPDFESA